MLVLFLLADIIIGKPVLSYAGHADILFAFLGIVMMAVYAGFPVAINAMQVAREILLRE